MAEEFDQIKYIQDYNEKNYERFTFRVQKGQMSEIKAAARAAGQSTNDYIRTAVFDRMKCHEKKP